MMSITRDLKDQVCICMASGCGERWPGIDFLGAYSEGEGVVVMVREVNETAAKWKKSFGLLSHRIILESTDSFVAIRPRTVTGPRSRSTEVSELTFHRGTSLAGGAISCFVEDENGQKYVLSTQHTLAFGGSTTISYGKAMIGKVEAVGDILDTSKVEKQVDAAIMSLEPVVKIGSGTICNYSAILGPGSTTVAVGDSVKKCGPETNSRNGIVVDTDGCALVEFPGIDELRFVHQIIIGSSDRRIFADDGDSGSLVTANGQAVGILMARNRSHSRFAVNPISNVLDSLGAKSGHRFSIIHT